MSAVSAGIAGKDAQLDTASRAEIFALGNPAANSSSFSIMIHQAGLQRKWGCIVQPLEMSSKIDLLAFGFSINPKSSTKSFFAIHLEQSAFRLGVDEQSVAII